MKTLRTVKIQTDKDLALQVSVARDVLANKAYTKEGLAIRLGLSFDELSLVIADLKKKTDIQYTEGLYSILKPEMGKMSVKVFGGEWNKIGLVADTHLGCKEARIDELHAQYDHFQREGITKVFHAGNPVDGYIPKINGDSCFATTSDAQIQLMIDTYPQRKGIKTYYITGDDHEGWWIQRGFNFGRDLQLVAKSQGRDDLVYIGHVEADIEFKAPSGSAILKIQHPGGGSSYARSYTGQKQVEAFEGGEKPAILVQGHYHVSNYMQDRGVHVVSMPGFQDQTIFARKKRLRMEVGGAIMEFTQDDSGSIARFRLEWNRYFTRSYYRKFLTSDAKAVKGHLVFGSAA